MLGKLRPCSASRTAGPSTHSSKFLFPAKHNFPLQARAGSPPRSSPGGRPERRASTDAPEPVRRPRNCPSNRCCPPRPSPRFHSVPYSASFPIRLVRQDSCHLPNLSPSRGSFYWATEGDISMALLGGHFYRLLTRLNGKLSRSLAFCYTNPDLNFWMSQS